MKNFTLLMAALFMAASAFSQVVDSDFSNWTDGAPDGWSGTKTNLSAASINAVDNDGGEGDFAVQLIRPESQHQRFTTQPLTVEAGENYEITFWARGNGDVRTGLFDDRADGFGYVYNSYVALNSTEWQEYSQSIVAEENTAEAEFILSVRNTTADMHVQIDRVVISTADIETVSVYDIQFTEDPSGDSPYVGQTVTTSGVVSGIKEDEGFFLQGGAGPWNGIFVFTQQETNLGDEVVFSANVVEHFNMTQLSGVTGFTTLSSGNALEVAGVSTADVNTEPYEGVLVQVTNATCTDPNSGFGQFVVNDGSGPCFINRDIYDFVAFQNEVYNITGQVFFSFSEFKLMPRFAADVEISTSIPEITSEDGILIFPNPAKDVLNLEWQNAHSGVVEYQLFSISGRLVKSGALQQPFSSLNLSGLAPGWYSLNLIDDAEIKHARIVVER